MSDVPKKEIKFDGVFSDFFLEERFKRCSHGCLRSQYFLGIIWKERFLPEREREGTRRGTL